MIKNEINKKIIPYRVTAVAVEMNLKLEKIVGQILSIMTTYDSSIFRDGNTSSVLFISSHIYNKIEIEVPKSFTTFDFPGDTLTIKAMSAYEFLNMSDTDRNILNSFSVILIGFVNCIPEVIMSNILNSITYQLVYIFGDRLIDSPELGEYAQRMISAPQFSIKTDSSAGDLVTSKKRMSSLIKKMRESKFVTSGNDEAFDGVTIKHGHDINTSEIESFLKHGGTVVVPRRFIADVNSIILRDTNVGPAVGATVYNLVPYVYYIDGKKLIIPPITPITIVRIGNTYESNGALITLMDMMCDINGINNVMMGVAVNMTSYLLSFNPNMQIANMDEYNYILSNMRNTSYNESIHDFNFMYITPFRLMSSNYIKYSEPEHLLCYIESIVRSDLYSQDTSYFGSVCRVRGTIDLRFNYEFNEVL